MWFYLLVGYDVNDFYTSHYSTEFPVEALKVDIKFLPDQATTKSKIDLSKIKLNWVNNAGINITTDDMGRRFIENNLHIDEQDM